MKTVKTAQKHCRGQNVVAELVTIEAVLWPGRLRESTSMLAGRKADDDTERNPVEDRGKIERKGFAAPGVWP
jgi:hypothetical protein